MKLLVVSLLLCSAWAQTNHTQGQTHVNNTDTGEGLGQVVINDHGSQGANKTEAEGADEMQDDSGAGSSRCWERYNGREFRFFKNKLTWARAQKECIKLGGNLAAIHNQEEDNFVKNLADGLTAWIGFSDAQEDQVWLWINSSPMEYTGWCVSEPNNAGGPQECAVTNFSDNKCWDDQRCSAKRTFVCERTQHP